MSVPFCGVTGQKAEYYANWRAHRRHAPNPSGHTEFIDDFRANFVDSFSSLNTQRRSGLRNTWRPPGAEQTFIDGDCKATSLSWFQQLTYNAAGDAGSAGWWAVVLLIGLLFVDPEVRAKPQKCW